MANLMPLVHQARRTIRNRQDGNPFTTDQLIADLIEALGSAYLAAPVNGGEKMHRRGGARMRQSA